MLSHSGNNVRLNSQQTNLASSPRGYRRVPVTTDLQKLDAARLHALIAAHRAFDRSHDRSSTNLTGSESITDYRGRLQHSDRCNRSSPASHLQRQRSTLQNRVTKVAGSAHCPATNAYESEEDRDSRISYVTEFGGHNENYGAEPSSYRKLRKAKSLISPYRRPQHSSSNRSETSMSQNKSLRPVISTAAMHSPGLKVRLKRSLNFLRSNHPGKHRNLTAPPKLQTIDDCHPEAIALARSRFVREEDKPELCKKQSFVITDRAQRAQTALQSTSTTSDGRLQPKNSSITLDQNSTQSISEKKLFSSGLNEKVRKFFRRIKHEAHIPPQQLNAMRAHYDFASSAQSPEAGFDSYLGPDVDAVKRTSFYMPSYVEGKSDDETNYLSPSLNRSGSCESITHDSKSRVTSWTNSTLTGSITTQPTVDEPKRLSVIKEDGVAHQPSSSAGRHIGGISAFQKPLNVPKGRSINSQRIYSALMRRINQEQKEKDETKAALKEIHKAQEQDDVVGHYLFSAPTIRRVQSKSSVSLPNIREADKCSSDTLSSYYRSYTTKNENENCEQSKQDKSSSPSQETLSSFYPFSNENGPGMRSPFRRFLDTRTSQLNMKSPEIIADRQNNKAVACSTVQTRPSSSACERSTESVYSRTTNGGTNAAYMSPTPSTDEFEHPNVCTAARASKKQLYRFTDSSSSDSVNDNIKPRKGVWADWMDSQKAGVYGTKNKQQTHFREKAQIDPEETNIGSEQSPDRASQISTATTQKLSFKRRQTLSSRLHARPVTTSDLRKISSSIELKEVPRNSGPSPNENMGMVRSQSAAHHKSISPDRSDVTTKISRARKSKGLGLQKVSMNGTGNTEALEKCPLTHYEQQEDLGKENSRIYTNGCRTSTSTATCQPQEDNGKPSADLQRDRSRTVGSQLIEPSPYDYWRSRIVDSPSNKEKPIVSSRLSRPFMMDMTRRE